MIVDLSSAQQQFCLFLSNLEVECFLTLIHENTIRFNRECPIPFLVSLEEGVKFD